MYIAIVIDRDLTLSYDAPIRYRQILCILIIVYSSDEPHRMPCVCQKK